MPDSTSRPRGILTPNDRELLLGLTEYDHKQQYSNRRNKIRERVTNGLLDFSLLQYCLQDRDRKRIFRNPGTEASQDNVQFYESLESLLFWVYLGMKEQNFDFEKLLIDAIKAAEEEYALKYLGTSVETSVTFNVETKRSNDIEELIDLIEQGGPVPASRLYDLLKLTGGVPIDTSNLDTVRVLFGSGYPSGERAVVEAIFSEYLGADVEIEEAGIQTENKKEAGRESAVIESEIERPNPSSIPNSSSSTNLEKEMKSNLEGSIEGDEGMRLRREASETRQGGPSPTEDRGMSLADVVDGTVEDTAEVPSSIESIIRNQGPRNEPVTSEAVVELLKTVSDSFVSTHDVAAVFDSAPEAARGALEKASAMDRVNAQSVRDASGQPTWIWYVSE